MPGARHGSVLRRAPGRPAGRRHQGRFHRLPRLRPQHRHRHVDHLGHGLGTGAAGDLVQQRRQSALCVPGYRADGGLPRRIGLRGLARHSRAPGLLVDSPASMVVTNADGYRYVVAPMVDGYLWQGLEGQRQPERHEDTSPDTACDTSSATTRRLRPPITSRSAKGRRRFGSRTFTPRARRRARFASSSPPRFSRALPTSTR